MGKNLNLKAINISRIVCLPEDLSALAVKARAEGFRFLERLMVEFESGANRFSREGEALFEARYNGVLAGVGGLNRDPYIVASRSSAEAGNVGRIRRLYVDPAYRRHGIAKLMMEAIERLAQGSFRQLRLRTDTDTGAQFYQRLGYEVVANDANASHCKTIGNP